MNQIHLPMGGGGTETPPTTFHHRVSTILRALEHFQQHLRSSFKKSHGIDIDHSKSPFHNAVHIFNSATTTDNCTLPLPSNLAFHDLTQDKSAPPEAKALLGLGGKFILTPPITTGDISASLRGLLRDLCIKVIFSGQEQEDHNQEKISVYMYNPPGNQLMENSQDGSLVAWNVLLIK